MKAGIGAPDPFSEPSSVSLRCSGSCRMRLALCCRPGDGSKLDTAKRGMMLREGGASVLWIVGASSRRVPLYEDESIFVTRPFHGRSFFALSLSIFSNLFIADESSDQGTQVNGMAQQHLYFLQWSSSRRTTQALDTPGRAVYGHARGSSFWL